MEFYFIFFFCGNPDVYELKNRDGRMASWPRGYKTFFMLNSTEHDFFHAHKC